MGNQPSFEGKRREVETKEVTFKMRSCDLKNLVRQRGEGEREDTFQVRPRGRVPYLFSLFPDIQALKERHHLNILKNHAVLLFKCLKIMVNFIGKEKFICNKPNFKKKYILCQILHFSQRNHFNNLNICIKIILICQYNF